MCGEKCLKFELPVLICSGLCNQRIKKNSVYFIANDGTVLWCHKCYLNLSPVITVPSTIFSSLFTCEPLLKKSLLKRRLDYEVSEPWVKCDFCKMWLHQVCALYNNRYNYMISRTCTSNQSTQKYECPSCKVKNTSKKVMTTNGLNRRLSLSMPKPTEIAEPTFMFPTIMNSPLFLNTTETPTELQPPVSFSSVSFDSLNSFSPTESTATTPHSMLQLCSRTDNSINVHKGDLVYSSQQLRSLESTTLKKIEWNSEFVETCTSDRTDNDQDTSESDTENYSHAADVTGNDVDGNRIDINVASSVCESYISELQKASLSADLPKANDSSNSFVTNDSISPKFMINNSHPAVSNIDSHSEVRDKNCYLETSAVVPSESQSQWQASTLPRCKLSNFLESILRDRLQQSGLGGGIGQDYSFVSDTLNVRVVGNSNFAVDVPREISVNLSSSRLDENSCDFSGVGGELNDKKQSDKYNDMSSSESVDKSPVNNFTTTNVNDFENLSSSQSLKCKVLDDSNSSRCDIPNQLPYRQKCVLLFQCIDGVDVCVFCLYVQEFDSNCPPPNTAVSYLAYLDSVDYFRPPEVRTLVYHELIVGYMAWLQARGFKQCHIWSCPPQRGQIS